MPIHELKRYRAICTGCRRFIDYEAINRTHVPSGWTVTKGKTLADVTVLCLDCSGHDDDPFAWRKACGVLKDLAPGEPSEQLIRDMYDEEQEHAND